MPEITALNTERETVNIQFDLRDVANTLSVLYGVGSGSDAVNPQTARLRELLVAAQTAFMASCGSTG